MNIKIYNNAKGFTLVELLISMVVVMVIGSVIVSILFAVLRGTNKTNKRIIVRQNGNYAISQLSKIIRNAKSAGASCTPTPSVSIDLVAQDNTPITLACSIGDTISVTSGGSTTNLLDTTSVKITRCSFSCPVTVRNTDLVVVSFDVAQLSDTATNENSAKLTFETAIAIRSTN